MSVRAHVCENGQSAVCAERTRGRHAPKVFVTGQVARGETAAEPFQKPAIYCHFSHHNGYNRFNRPYPCPRGRAGQPGPRAENRERGQQDAVQSPRANPHNDHRLQVLRLEAPHGRD
jgi:hypothetical protein